MDNLKIEKQKAKEEQERMREMIKYEEEYGSGMFEYKAVADELIERMLKGNSKLVEDYTGYGEFKRNVRTNFKGSDIQMRWLFPTLYDRYYTLLDSRINIKKYEWAIYERFDISDLNNVILFQEHLVNLEKQFRNYQSIVSEIQEQGIESAEIIAIQEDAFSFMQKTMEQMEFILNPVTQKFYDNTSKEEALLERLNQKVGEMVKQIIPSKDVPINKEYQLISLSQLQTVLKNEKVSDETKEKAKQTMKAIESSIALEEERQEREEAELEAHAIIQASAIVHRLNDIT